MAAIFNAGQAGKDLTQADQFLSTAPTITAQPQGLSRSAGETASFSVAAAGTAPLSYQWKLNNQNIPTGTNATYRIASVKASDAGQYVVVVKNSGGTIESQPVTLTVSSADLISAGLIGYWKFDEREGEAAADASAGSHPATLSNFPGDNSQWIQGRVGGALQLGGPEAQHFGIIEDYAKPTSTMTVALWVWADSVSSWSSWVKNWGGSEAGQFHFGIFADGLHQNIFIKQADGKTPNVSDPDPFPTESWQHVAFVCDGSKVRLYRNGAEVASTDYDGTLVTPPMNCIGVGIKTGNDCTGPGGPPGYWHGRMDDFGIWNRGLSAQEMFAIFKAGEAGKGVTEADSFKPSAPLITAQPRGLNTFEGTAVKLTVGVTGAEPLSYQWLKNGQPIPDATAATLDLGLVGVDTTGKYKVTVSNALGNVTSDEASVVVSKRVFAKLVSEWRFEDNLEDSSGNQNHGTAKGTAAFVEGKWGKAVRLAGANPVVNEAAKNLPAKGTDSWSINLWLKLAEAPKALAYLAGFGSVKDDGAGTARSLLAFSGAQNNNIYAWGSSRDTATDTAYPLNRWAMITITHDGANGATAIFLDGQQIGQNVQPRADLVSAEHKISLAPTSHWNTDVGGDFDEFSIWSGVLNPAQIADLAIGGDGYAVKLVSEWRFEDNLTDTSGSGNDGTAAGTVEYVPGIKGKAVKLAPENPIVNEAAKNLPLKGTSSWSINLWLNLAEQPASLAYLAGFGPVRDAGGGTARALLAFSGSRANNIYAWGSSSDTPTDLAYPVGRWAMVTITHDGRDRTTTIYLDGSQIGQNISARSDIPEGEVKISLAPRSNWGIEVGGMFDEFTVWQGVLQPNQINDLAGKSSPVNLSVQLSGAKIVVAWPAESAGFVLESADKLPAATWTPVAGAANNRFEVSAGSGVKYFRLRK